MKIKILFLILVIGLGAALRFWDLSSRGLFSHDEGYYFLGAKTLATAANYIKIKFLGSKKERLELPRFGEYLRKEGGDYPVGAKHGFYILGAIGLLFFGVKDYAILYTSAIFGVLSIILIYLIAKNIFSEITAFLAALLLAVSPFHITYSRSGYSQVTATFFILLGIYFYLKATEKRNKFLILAGLSFGYAVTCHPNQLWIMSIFIFDFLVYKKIRRLITLIASSFLPLLVMQAISLAAIYIAKSIGWKSIEEINTLMLPYFGQVFKQGKYAGGMSFLFEEPFFYAKLLLKFEGILTFSLFIIGTFFIALKKNMKYPETLIGLLAIFPFLLWSGYINKVARTILPIIPFILLVAAQGIKLFFDFLRPRLSKISYNFSFISLCAFLILEGVSLSLDDIKAKSGYPLAIDFLIKNGHLKHFTSCTTLSACYMPENYKYVYMPEEVSLLKAKEAFKNKGFRYLILDYTRFSFKNSELLNFMNQSKNSPVFSVEAKPYKLFIYDDQISSNRPKIAKIHSVEVYDLTQIFGENKI